MTTRSFGSLLLALLFFVGCVDANTGLPVSPPPATGDPVTVRVQYPMQIDAFKLLNKPLWSGTLDVTRTMRVEQ